MTQLRRIALSFGLIMLFLLLYLSVPGFVFAEGAVTSVVTRSEPSTPSRYTVGENTFTWGMETNQILESFTYRGESYGYLSTADKVAVKRVGQSGGNSIEACSVFAERAANFTQLKPSFPSDSANTGNCDVAAILSSRVVNRGVTDVFLNEPPDPQFGQFAAKDIERIDVVFSNGIVAPLQAALLEKAGHLASEKRGNNPVQMAAILALDSSGEPSAYGPLIRIGPFGCTDPAICYGVTPLSHNYSFFATSTDSTQGSLSYVKDSTESVAMAFLSLDTLGITSGQQYFGFSYFPADVDPALHTLTDPSSFPADTADLGNPVDGADIYGGISGYFIADDSTSDRGNQITSIAFIDVNGDGMKTDDEAGLDGITVSLFQDTNGNGLYDAGTDQPVGTPSSTNASGTVFFPGVPNGQYLVLLDEADTDIPPGVTLPPGLNPGLVVLPAAVGNDVNFAFMNIGGGGAGPTAVNDSENVRQNTLQSLDVLKNDSTNPPGGMLEIVTVGGIANGTANIVNGANGATNGAISYRSAADFVGQTAFYYVIENASGQQATANVALNVTRFSDINNDGENDFVQCGCNDLGLITGIHGSGVGALDLGSALLGGLFWYRRRRYPRGRPPGGADQ